MSVGVEALPIVSLISFFVGTILALQGAYELRSLGALQLVASAVAISMTRELGPLMTAIIVIGRSGSAFAAEIGTMKVNEEIDALETMALEPVRFLVAPKFVAMLLMMPCLTTWSDFMGVLGGGLFGVTNAGLHVGDLFQATLDALDLRDIMTGLIKSVMFGACDYCRRLPGRVFHRPWLGAGRTFDNFRRGEIDLYGIAVDLVFTAIFYFTAPQVRRCQTSDATGIPGATRRISRFRCGICASIWRARDFARHQFRSPGRRDAGDPGRFGLREEHPFAHARGA